VSAGSATPGRWAKLSETDSIFCAAPNQIALARDVVAVGHRARLVAADVRGASLQHAAANPIPHSGPSQIME
jgi:hypothetical protein